MFQSLASTGRLVSPAGSSSMQQVMTFFYYFAYGSNLLGDRIRYKQKGAEYECNGRLDNFRLEFANYSQRWQGALATLVESPGKEVWGCVWKMPNEYSDSLDEQEKGYHRLMVPVHTPQGVINCRTYQYSDLDADPMAPSPHYKLVIVTGAKENKLPVEYIKRLENIHDNGFVGSVDVDIPLLAELNSQKRDL